MGNWSSTTAKYKNLKKFLVEQLHLAEPTAEQLLVSDELMVFIQDVKLLKSQLEVANRKNVLLMNRHMSDSVENTNIWQDLASLKQKVTTLEAEARNKKQMKEEIAELKAQQEWWFLRASEDKQNQRAALQEKRIETLKSKLKQKIQDACLVE